ncbi:MAG TPA: RagB/SusD family nutrient uptake outer membrane protein [Prolixibacteraceae bacterium]|nr:RagB/SusD family nutrient uptake outer membrane protein [Prolixibacteraceae bacterium]
MESKYKIHTKIVILTVLVFFSGACTKLEDKNYSELVAKQFNPTQDDISSLVGPAYVSWQWLWETGMEWYSGLRYTQEICGDELVIPRRPNGWVDGGIYRNMFMHDWTVFEPYSGGNWITAYKGVTNTNRILYQIESGAIPVKENKENLIAELKVLRTSFYWVLCDLFGNVPVVTQFDVAEGYLPKQNTRKEVNDFIISEITKSLPLLSEEVNASTYGRFTKWGAYTLLAKMYLNAEVYTGIPEWDKCIAACDAVINSGKYILEPIRKDVFKAKNENSKETVFAIPYDEKYAQSWGAAMNSLQPQSQEVYNMQGTPWGGSCAVPQFIDSYDPEDLRLKDWVQGPQYSSSGERLVGAMDLPGVPFSYLNEVPSIDFSTEMSGYREWKQEYEMGLQSFMNNDAALLRYADVLMMKAEALLRSGHADEAAIIVSQVRERSFPGNPEKAVVTGSDLQKGSGYKYGLKDSVNGWNTNEGGTDIKYGRFLDELGWEFSQEGHRRQDLIRFGVFTTKSWLSHSPNGNHRTMFAIPQDEINRNPNLSQNPGY